jgi:lysophospholipid acyltransferase (LPLAT)-like uncharacterized protein
MPGAPRRSRSSRELTPARRALYWVVVHLAKGLVEFFWYGSRRTVVGQEKLAALLKDGAVIPVCWHQHLLICARYTVSIRNIGLKPGFMISPSVDGEAPTMLALTYGAQVVRGSGSYTGVRALLGSQKAIKRDGISPLITPDGPRGPRFKFKPGAIFTAQASGRPIVPIAFAAKPAWIFKTWDKFALPVPFARVCIAIGEPLYVPREVSEERMRELQDEMVARMHATYKQAAAALTG